MKKIIFAVIIVFITTITHAQLRCKEIKHTDGSTEKKCFHQNGQVSTIELWDVQKRSGTLRAYSNNGKELFNYGLRRFAGHSSVYLTYHANGQVKKAEYSSAPDGGIQFWHIIHYYDENGIQTEYFDYSQPDGRPTLHVTFDTSKYYQYEPKKEIQQNNIKPTVPDFRTDFVLVNETKTAVTVLCKAKVGNMFTAKDTLIQLVPKQKIIFASRNLPGKFIDEIVFSPELAMNTKKNAKFKIITAAPAENDKIKTYTWHVINK